MQRKRFAMETAETSRVASFLMVRRPWYSPTETVGALDGELRRQAYGRCLQNALSKVLR